MHCHKRESLKVATNLNQVSSIQNGPPNAHPPNARNFLALLWGLLRDNDGCFVAPSWISAFLRFALLRWLEKMDKKILTITTLWFFGRFWGSTLLTKWGNRSPRLLLSFAPPISQPRLSKIPVQQHRHLQWFLELLGQRACIRSCWIFQLQGFLSQVGKGF